MSRCLSSARASARRRSRLLHGGLASGRPGQGHDRGPPPMAQPASGPTIISWHGADPTGSGKAPCLDRSTDARASQCSGGVTGSRCSTTWATPGCTGSAGLVPRPSVSRRTIRARYGLLGANIPVKRDKFWRSGGARADKLSLLVDNERCGPA